MRALRALLARYAAHEAAAVRSRIGLGAAGAIVTALLGTLGLGFFLLAAYLGLTERIGPIRAGLVCGSALVILALVTYLLFAALERRAKEKRAKARAAEAAAMVSVATGLVPTLLKGKAAQEMLGAAALAALGYAIYQENARKPNGPGASED